MPSGQKQTPINTRGGSGDIRRRSRRNVSSSHRTGMSQYSQLLNRRRRPLEGLRGNDGHNQRNAARAATPAGAATTGFPGGFRHATRRLRVLTALRRSHDGGRSIRTMRCGFPRTARLRRRDGRNARRDRPRGLGAETMRNEQRQRGEKRQKRSCRSANWTACTHRSTALHGHIFAVRPLASR
jgi:hypothetical protein